MRAAGLLLIAAALLEAAPPANPPTFEADRVLSGDRPIPLAPGLHISIYGSHLGPMAGCQGYADTERRETPSPLRPKQTVGETLIYPKVLCDTQVFVGGIAAGLLWVQDGQINFKVPQEAPITGTAKVRVVYQGQASRPVTLPLGLESTTMSLETPAAVGMPVWLKVSFGPDESIQYPFDIHPAEFNCQEVEVRRDGKLLPRVASLAAQAFGGTPGSGLMCGSLGLRAKSHHLGRIPLHLQYRFDQPGTYEVRYTFRKGSDPAEPPDVQSAWTPIEILPGSPAERARWLAEMAAHAPTDAVDLLTDFLPAIMGVPDEPSLQLLCQYLYHPDTLVRQFAMYGLTYWPDDQAGAAVMELARTSGPSDVAVEFLSFRSKLTAAQVDSIVESAIPYLRSDAPVVLLGAVTALYRIAQAEDSPTGSAVRARAENALMDAAAHIVSAGDTEIAHAYAMALGMVKDQRAGDLLWDLVSRDLARSQAVIAITWRKTPADLPKLAELALRPAHGNNLDYALTSLPYALHRAYGDAALPYLETMLERSEFTWVRTNSARELVIAGRPAGFAFIVDALEHDRRYRTEMLQFIRDQFPNLSQSGDPAILSFVQSRAVSPPR